MFFYYVERNGNMKKVLIILTFILLLTAFASAETTVLRFDFDLYSNDTIILKDITASTGTFEESENGDLPYQMVLVDEDNVMHLLSFVVLPLFWPTTKTLSRPICPSPVTIALSSPKHLSPCNS